MRKLAPKGIPGWSGERTALSSEDSLASEPPEEAGIAHPGRGRQHHRSLPHLLPDTLNLLVKRTVMIRKQMEGF